MTKYSFISPHFDDAILSCGAMMVKEDNTEIITVFSGAPININITEYDKKCGFKSSFEAMNERALDTVIIFIETISDQWNFRNRA